MNEGKEGRNERMEGKEWREGMNGGKEWREGMEGMEGMGSEALRDRNGTPPKDEWSGAEGTMTAKDEWNRMDWGGGGFKDGKR